MIWLTRVAMMRLIASSIFVFAVQSASAQVDAGLPDLPPSPKPQLPSPDEFADGQMAALDANHDHKVTWAEFSARLRKAFDDMDKKHRGYLTREDLKAAYLKALSEAPTTPTPIQ